MPRPLLPNDEVEAFSGTATVIASVHYNDDDPDWVTQTLLLMHREPPYFQVVIFNPLEGMSQAIPSDRIYNIVPAVEQYKEWGGDY